MDKYNSEVYNDYLKSSHTCSFEEYLYDEYKLLQFYFEQSEMWANDLGSLICDIHRSGLLKSTEYENKIKHIYSAIECETR